MFLPTQQKVIAAGQWLSKRTPLFSHLINSLAELLLGIRCVMCGESALLPAEYAVQKQMSAKGQRRTSEKFRAEA